MIVRLVKMGFREDAIEEFRQVFAESKDLIRAFPGNHHVELLQDQTQTGVFFTYSIWDSEGSLEAYRHSELFERTWARTKILFNTKPEAWTTVKRGEGQPA